MTMRVQRGRTKKRNPPPKRSNGCVRHRDGKILRKANNSGELSCRTTRRRRRRRTRTKNQAGGSLDVQKWLGKTGMEFHWPGYQYMGPGTHLKKRLARGDKGINRLDKIAKIHDIDYSRAKNLQDKWAADRKASLVKKCGLTTGTTRRRPSSSGFTNSSNTLSRRRS